MSDGINPDPSKSCESLALGAKQFVFSIFRKDSPPTLEELAGWLAPYRITINANSGIIRQESDKEGRYVFFATGTEDSVSNLLKDRADLQARAVVTSLEGLKLEDDLKRELGLPTKFEPGFFDRLMKLGSPLQYSFKIRVAYPSNGKIDPKLRLAYLSELRKKLSECGLKLGNGRSQNETMVYNATATIPAIANAIDIAEIVGFEL